MLFRSHDRVCKVCQSAVRRSEENSFIFHPDSDRPPEEESVNILSQNFKSQSYLAVVTS